MVSAASFEETFLPTVARLNRASVTKRYEAHRDIDWDAADARIDPRDPRFCLSTTNALGATSWYRSLPEETRAALGLEWVCQTLRVGITFESCLSRGLLEFAGTLPNGSPLYRYAMHEVVEESHHSMMFHEFIRRSGCAPEDVPGVERSLQRLVARFGATFPELFFLAVLSGEVFVDHDNRERLRAGDALHPLVRRMMHIHVTEEARHVCFAQAYLREHLPRAPVWKRQTLRAIVPLLFWRGEHQMMRPFPVITRRYGIPREVLEEAFGPGSAHEARMREIVQPIYALVGRA